MNNNILEKNFIEKLKWIETLKHGWCQGYEIPPSLLTISSAKELANFFNNIGFKVDVFPGDENDILVSCYIKDYVLTVDVSENFYSSIYIEKGEGYDITEVFCQENPSLEDIKIIIYIYNNIL